MATEAWKPRNRKGDLAQADPDLFEVLDLINQLLRYFYQRDVDGWCTLFSDIALKLLHDAGYKEAYGIRVYPKSFGPALKPLRYRICSYLWHDFVRIGPWNADFSLQQFGLPRFLVTRFDDEDALAIYGECTINPEGADCASVSEFVYDDGSPASPSVKSVLATDDMAALRKLKGLRFRRIIHEFRRTLRHKPTPRSV